MDFRTALCSVKILSVLYRLQKYCRSVPDGEAYLPSLWHLSEALGLAECNSPGCYDKIAQTEVYSLWLWRLRSSVHGRFEIWWGAAFWLSSCLGHLCWVSEVRGLSPSGLFLKALVPVMRAPPVWSYHLLGDSTSWYHRLGGIGFQNVNLEEDPTSDFMEEIGSN